MSCSLVPRPGVPVDGYLFGLNSILGPIVTLPYDDPELLAAGRALGAGTLRWPGGTVANFWSIKDCNYAASAISSWKDRYDARVSTTGWYVLAIELLERRRLGRAWHAATGLGAERAHAGRR